MDQVEDMDVGMCGCMQARRGWLSVLHDTVGDHTRKGPLNGRAVGAIFLFARPYFEAKFTGQTSSS